MWMHLSRFGTRCSDGSGDFGIFCDSLFERPFERNPVYFLNPDCQLVRSFD